jgi:hypothetical protein
MSTNRLPLDENTRRLPGWSEGECVTLADGQRWCFPPKSHPEYAATAAVANHEITRALLPLHNFPMIEKQGQDAQVGDVAGLVETMDRFFRPYRSVFAAGSTMLRYNYNLSDAEIDRLMPFNYQLSELADPTSNASTATPLKLAVPNAVARAIGLDLKPELDAIAQSN